MNAIDSAVQTFSCSIELQNRSLSGTTCIATRFQVGSKFNIHAVFKIQINTSLQQIKARQKCPINYQNENNIFG